MNMYMYAYMHIGKRKVGLGIDSYNYEYYKVTLYTMVMPRHQDETKLSDTGTYTRRYVRTTMRTICTHMYAYMCTYSMYMHRC